jgi:hypothetical protein
MKYPTYKVASHGKHVGERRGREWSTAPAFSHGVVLGCENERSDSGVDDIHDVTHQSNRPMTSARLRLLLSIAQHCSTSFPVAHRAQTFVTDMTAFVDTLIEHEDGVDGSLHQHPSRLRVCWLPLANLVGEARRIPINGLFTRTYLSPSASPWWDLRERHPVHGATLPPQGADFRYGSVNKTEPGEESPCSFPRGRSGTLTHETVRRVMSLCSPVGWANTPRHRRS